MTNTERIQAHNAELREAIEMAEKLPDAGGGDSEIVDAILDGTITELASDATSLSDYALANRKNLTSISLPNVKTIGQYAFSRSGFTYGYVNISLPSLVSAGDYAFYSADFREITLPKLLVVSSFMFNSASIIKKVDLGSATQIKGASFIGCTNIETLIIRTNTVCSLAYATVFNSSAILGGTGYIYVPSALVDSYKSATNWSTYANQVRAIEDYPEITGG
jgi:hypothetical protein